MYDYFCWLFFLDGKPTSYALLILSRCFRFDGNFNTNVSRTVSCDRLSTTVNSRAFNPGRDLNSGQHLAFHFLKVKYVPHSHTEQMQCLKCFCFHFKRQYYVLKIVCVSWESKLYKKEGKTIKSVCIKHVLDNCIYGPRQVLHQAPQYSFSFHRTCIFFIL